MDTPLNENGIVGTAIGMALAGLRPVAEIQFAGFSLTAFDQLATHAARYGDRSGGALSVPLVVRMPAGGGHSGYEGHTDSPEALFAHVPGLTVAYPSSAADAAGLLRSALDHDGPVVLLETTAAYGVLGEVAQPIVPVPFGRALTLRRGGDVTVVTYGPGVRTVLEAAEGVSGDGDLEVEVIDLRTIRPWDVDAVLGSVKRTGRLVVVHDAPHTAGFGAEVVATVVESGVRLVAAPRRVTHADAPPAAPREQESAPDAVARVAAALRAVVDA
jgi:pyruvate dehydrogenase E1 component beta subunit